MCHVTILQNSAFSSFVFDSSKIYVHTDQTNFDTNRHELKKHLTSHSKIQTSPHAGDIQS